MTQAGRGLAAAARHDFHKARTIALDAVGGPARGRVVLVLAAVLALNGADTGTISATTDNLEQAFHIGNTQIGLLLTIVALVGALFTIPVGILTDRTTRTTLLAGSIVGWAAAMALSGLATSYLWLLLARVALGIMTATSGPTVASLTGDFFPAADRGRMYGLIIAGDLVGTGIGYVISGDISSLTTWRVAFWWLVLPSLALAWAVWGLPEPARGGMSPIAAGTEHLPGHHAAHPGQRGATAGAAGQSSGPDTGPGEDLAGEIAGQRGVQPQEDLVLHRDPTDRSVWWAVRYVLRVRTNVVIIVASALGYFFFAGLRSLGEAAAPLTFGYVSQYVFGGPGSSAARAGSGVGTAANATGLEYTLLLFLIPLIVAGLLALLALRTYPRDVATAAALVQAIREADGSGPRRSAA